MLTASCTAISSAHSRRVVKIAFFQDLSVGDPLELVSPSFLAMQAAVEDHGTGLGSAIRIDQFDTRGNRLGYGTTTTPRPTPDPHQSDRTPTNGTTKGGR